MRVWACPNYGIVNQARLHELLVDGMANTLSNLRPHYSRELLELSVDESCLKIWMPIPSLPGSTHR